MANDIKTGISLLKQGLAPDNSELLRLITVEFNNLVDFYCEQYFREYISQGGSKIKFITGKTGSGKTHLLQLLSLAAEEQGFATVHFSAKDIWLHDFKEIYAEIYRRTDLLGCLTRCADKIIGELGYTYTAIPDGLNFADYLSSIGELDALVKKEIRNQLRKMFLKNPLIDNNFAIACSLLTGGILGHPALEGANRELLLSWLGGDKEVKIVALRKLGLSPSRITKHNARHMLRSLVEVHKAASYPGIVVLVDDLDILANTTTLDTIRYTKLRREDAYESIRELIDDIDALRNIMFFFAFGRQLIDDELCGMKSYQALWLRIQNEIVSSKFNHFTDIIDLDRYCAEVFTKDILLAISHSIANTVNLYNFGANTISSDTADQILSNARYATTSFPRQVALATVNPSLVSEEIADD